MNRKQKKNWKKSNNLEIEKGYTSFSFKMHMKINATIGKQKLINYLKLIRYLNYLNIYINKIMKFFWFLGCKLFFISKNFFFIFRTKFFTFIYS